MHAKRLSAVTVLLLWVAAGLVQAGWMEPAPVAEVNLDGTEEWSPFLSFDGLTLYFARVRGPQSTDGRIFQAIRDRPYGPFTRVEEVPGPLNASPGDVLCPWVSPDNLRMYYHNEVGSVFSLKLSERASVEDPWPQGDDIVELNVLGRRFLMPRLTADELTIVFGAGDIDGGEGGYDLWTAERASRYLPFENVRNLRTINTAFNETASYISPDGLQIYFVSNRNGTIQVFRADRPDLSASFGEPVHLSVLDIPGGYTSHPALSSDGTTLYCQREMNGDRSTRNIFVSHLGPDYYVDGDRGSDSNGGLSLDTAVATVQRAIDLAPEGAVIGLLPGVYREVIDFGGKAITVQSIGDAAVLEAPGNSAVSFISGEGRDSVLRNVVITNSNVGIFVFDAGPTITNVTVSGNDYGIEVYRDAGIEISSCILWGNVESDLYGAPAQYSCVGKGPEGLWGHMMIVECEDPLFVDSDSGDYHLRSERGRYWPEHDVWVLDAVTSPCIDAGDPTADYSAEQLPDGGRLNLGAYGGTAFASMSESPYRADFNADRIVDANDLDLFLEVWELEVAEREPGTSR